MNDFTYSIDRFEGEFAVCENKQTGEFVNIPKSNLPKDAIRGSIIIYSNGIYILDNTSTQNEQAEIQNMVNNLFKKK